MKSRLVSMYIKAMRNPYLGGETLAHIEWLLAMEFNMEAI